MSGYIGLAQDYSPPPGYIRLGCELWLALPYAMLLLEIHSKVRLRQGLVTQGV